MPQMIMLGSEMIRINPAKKTVEYSTSGGAQLVHAIQQ